MYLGKQQFAHISGTFLAWVGGRGVVVWWCGPPLQVPAVRGRAAPAAAPAAANTRAAANTLAHMRRSLSSRTTRAARWLWWTGTSRGA